MTEYEAASLAVQHASLAVEEAALTAAYWQTGISATTSALTLAMSSGLVLYGFRLMRQGTEQRWAEMDAAATAAEQRHTETMTALTELIRRTGSTRPDGKNPEQT